MNNKEFRDGLLAGVLLTLALASLVMFIYMSRDEQTPAMDAFDKGPSYFNAYNEGVRYVPQMQAQDSIDTAILELQSKYQLSDDETEELYQQLVD